MTSDIENRLVCTARCSLLWWLNRKTASLLGVWVSCFGRTHNGLIQLLFFFLSLHFRCSSSHRIAMFIVLHVFRSFFDAFYFGVKIVFHYLAFDLLFSCPIKFALWFSISLNMYSIPNNLHLNNKHKQTKSNQYDSQRMISFLCFYDCPK